MTGNAERANVTLPDGRTVALKVASRLEECRRDYISVGNHHRCDCWVRRVFTSAQNAGFPFAVVADPVTMRALGATFRVRHYAADSVDTIAVRDGKVMVQSTGVPSVMLTAAQQLAIGQAGPTGVQEADFDQFNFETRVLTLKGVLFPAAIAELDRWYNVDIRLGDEALKTQHITGVFAAGSGARI